jgi:DNA-binding transcriptional LysR family regulator
VNLRQADLNLLLAFDILMTERSVSLAAEKLGVTQPAASHTLKRLRTLFDDNLFVRGPNGMQPTSRALAVYPQVRDVLASIHSLLSSTTEFDASKSSRTFRLSMSDAMSVEALPFIIRRIRRTAPNIDIVITTSGPQESCHRLAEDCACRKSKAGILVMEAAENWAAKNTPYPLYGARDRCIFLQR